MNFLKGYKTTMKKSLALILLLMIVISVFPQSFASFAAEPEEENTVLLVFDDAVSSSHVLIGDGSVTVEPGDLNGDGSVNVPDYSLLKKCIACVPVNVILEAADVNGDGKISVKDALTLKHMISGAIPRGGARSVSSGFASSAEYDQAECAAAVMASQSVTAVRFVPDEIASGFDAEDYRYVGIVMKTASDIENASVYGSFDGESDRSCFNVASDGAYHLKLFDMNENASWSGAKRALVLDLAGAVDDGTALYFDSFIMTNSLEALEATAAEREHVRNTPELNVANGNPGEVGADDAYDILFSDTNNLALLTNPYHATVEFSQSANCVAMTVSSEKTDPHVYLDLDGLNLSAEAYKYVVYTYKVPTTIRKADPDGELFMCAGDIAVPTGGYSKMFSLTKDGAFHSQIIDMNSDTYWSGKIHGIRLDFFCDAFAGDVSFVKSVILCRSLAAAQMAAARMSGASGSFETGLDAKNVADIFKDICTKDSTGNGYLRIDGGEATVCFTGGTHARFTKAHLESRLASLMASSVSTTCTVEIAEGFGEMKEDYDTTDGTNRYAVVKVKKDGAFCIMFVKIDFTMKKVIFDHDLGPDCDDAAAISIVAKAHRAGEINCLAITSCIYNDYSAYAAAAIVDYLGLLGEIRIGTNRARSQAGGGTRCCQTPAKNYWNTHGPWPVLENDTPLLREILASNGNRNDITFITTGPISTLYMLFTSGGDSFSPLSGRDLFINNVSLYVCGGGNFVNTGENEHNFLEDIDATLAVINSLTEVPMIFAGSNVAGEIYTGGVLASCDDAWVVKGCYYYQNYETGNYARNSWDLATVYFGVHGGCGLWEVRSGYNISVYTNGATIISGGGTNGYIMPIADNSVVAGVFSRGMIPN